MTEENNLIGEEVPFLSGNGYFCIDVAGESFIQKVSLHYVPAA